VSYSTLCVRLHYAVIYLPCIPENWGCGLTLILIIILGYLYYFHHFSKMRSSTKNRLVNVISWNSTVGTAADIGLEGPRIEFRCGRHFSVSPRTFPTTTQAPLNEHRNFPLRETEGKWSWLTTAFQRRDCEWVTNILLLLYVWGDLYI